MATALGLFSEMHELGILPDGSGWVVLLGDVKMWGVDQVRSSCSELATPGHGQQLHAEAIKAGLAQYAVAVISIFSRYGCLEDSLKVKVQIDVLMCAGHVL
ncbi:hypothetical protein M0R45_014884 [Rubus argutus]|uniref:Pentatricopeptide repeat-containing protein n=1 Tax=Rubus argutus TaxID=59490 RepID=A0AAW1XQ38_RUBAR